MMGQREGRTKCMERHLGYKSKETVLRFRCESQIHEISIIFIFKKRKLISGSLRHSSRALKSYQKQDFNF